MGHRSGPSESRPVSAAPGPIRTPVPFFDAAMVAPILPEFAEAEM